MTIKRIPPSKARSAASEVPAETKQRGRKAAGPKPATRAALPKPAKPMAAVTRRPAPAKARSAARPAVPPNTPHADPAAGGRRQSTPGSATQELNLPYGKTAPIPIRIATTVRTRLQNKAERTGVPMQELIRRSISHMLRTYKLDQVPDPAELE